MRPARLEIDFVAPPSRPRWPGVLLLTVAVALAAELHGRYQALQLELAALQAKETLLSAPRSPSRPASAVRAEDESKSAEAALRQLALPWGALMESVETAATDDVAILVLQPDALQRVLRLSAEARHADAMFEYLRRLGANRAIADVHLVSHQVQLDDPRKPVQFTVQAALRSAP